MPVRPRPLPQLALYVLSFLEPRDLLRAAQTCRYWRVLAEDNLLWREKCREEGKTPCPWRCGRAAAPRCRCAGGTRPVCCWAPAASPPAGIEEPLNLRKRRLLSPGFMYSPWKFAFMRQHKIDMNWRSGELKAPKVGVGESPWGPTLGSCGGEEAGAGRGWQRNIHDH